MVAGPLKIKVILAGIRRSSARYLGDFLLLIGGFNTVAIFQCFWKSLKVNDLRIRTTFSAHLAVVKWLYLFRAPRRVATSFETATLFIVAPLDKLGRNCIRELNHLAIKCLGRVRLPFRDGIYSLILRDGRTVCEGACTSGLVR